MCVWGCVYIYYVFENEKREDHELYSRLVNFNKFVNKKSNRDNKGQNKPT